MTDVKADGRDLATFGGGCFWCIEAVLQRIEGVLSVTSGYSGGTTPNPTYEEVCSGETGHAEAVQVAFDPSFISYEEILDIFWQAHDPTTLNRQGPDTVPSTDPSSSTRMSSSAKLPRARKRRCRRGSGSHCHAAGASGELLEGRGLSSELLQYPSGPGLLSDGDLPEAEEAEARVGSPERRRCRGAGFLVA